MPGPRSWPPATNPLRPPPRHGQATGRRPESTGPSPRLTPVCMWKGHTAGEHGETSGTLGKDCVCRWFLRAQRPIGLTRPRPSVPEREAKAEVLCFFVDLTHAAPPILAPRSHRTRAGTSGMCYTTRRHRAEGRAVEARTLSSAATAPRPADRRPTRATLLAPCSCRCDAAHT